MSEEFSREGCSAASDRLSRAPSTPLSVAYEALQQAKSLLRRSHGSASLHRDAQEHRLGNTVSLSASDGISCSGGTCVDDRIHRPMQDNVQLRAEGERRTSPQSLPASSIAVAKTTTTTTTSQPPPLLASHAAARHSFGRGVAAPAPFQAVATAICTTATTPLIDQLDFNEVFHLQRELCRGAVDVAVVAGRSQSWRGTPKSSTSCAITGRRVLAGSPWDDDDEMDDGPPVSLEPAAQLQYAAAYYKRLMAEEGEEEEVVEAIGVSRCEGSPATWDNKGVRSPLGLSPSSPTPRRPTGWSDSMNSGSPRQKGDSMSSSICCIPPHCDPCTSVSSALFLASGSPPGFEMATSPSHQSREPQRAALDAAPSTSRSPAQQWRISDFAVCHKINGGRAGELFLARERRSKSLVVLKRMREDSPIEGHNSMDRLASLQSFAARHHRFILASHGFLWDGGRCYYVLDYADGGDLCTYACRYAHRRLPESEVRRIVHQLVSAIAFLHSHGIWHCAIRPENVLLKQHVVKLNNFSRAIGSHYHRLSATARYRGQLELQGSLDYLAPELLFRSGTPSAMTDMWAVGVLTYVLLCGSPPFDHISPTRAKELITCGVVHYPSWVSPRARSFLCGLLSVSVAGRLTAAAALEHSFLCATDPSAREGVAAAVPLRAASMKSYSDISLSSLSVDDSVEASPIAGPTELSSFAGGAASKSSTVYSGYSTGTTPSSCPVVLVTAPRGGVPQQSSGQRFPFAPLSMGSEDALVGDGESGAAVDARRCGTATTATTEPVAAADLSEVSMSFTSATCAPRTGPTPRADPYGGEADGGRQELLSFASLSSLTTTLSYHPLSGATAMTGDPIVSPLSSASSEGVLATSSANAAKGREVGAPLQSRQLASRDDARAAHSRCTARGESKGGEGRGSIPLLCSSGNDCAQRLRFECLSDEEEEGDEDGCQ